MDFWSRLIAGGAKSKPLAEEEQRLARFRREAQNIPAWIKVKTKASASALVNIRTCTSRILTILREDARTAAQLTVSDAVSSEFYTSLSRLGAKLNDERVTRDAISLFGLLLSQDESLLTSESYAHALIILIQSTSRNKDKFTIGTETAILELSFDIAAKLRVHPDAVSAWFTEQDEADDASNDAMETMFEAPMDRTDFPLSHHFLEHVYQEGKSGDLARTGLLYIFDCATRSSELEEWIVESDLSRLLASGLGALYSQLSRKLTIAHPRESLPIILALSEEGNLPEETDIESFFSPDTQERLSTFTSYITFWRDMIGRCRSEDIKATLIDHFHVFFLQQVLYPAILESSDVDGGSAVAVLSYCWSLLESLQQEDLVHHMLHYLLALPGGAAASRPATSSGAQRPRSSHTMLMLERARQNQATLSPSFFSLVDLILASLSSSNAGALTSALRLVSLLLQHHHHYAVGSLVRVLPTKESSAKRTPGVLRQETSRLIDLAERLGGSSSLNNTYANSLQDALAMIESHDCSQDHQSLKPLHGEDPDDGEKGSRIARPAVYKHRLRLDDPLMLALLSLLDQFFINDVETNLALTEVLANLSSCPYVRLEGWLAAEPSVSRVIREAQSVQNSQFDGSELYLVEDEDDAEMQRVRAYLKACEEPEATSRNQPSLIMILHKLEEDLERATKQTVGFKQLVASRRRAFEGAAEMEEDTAKASPALSRRAFTPGSIRNPHKQSSPTKLAGSPTNNGSVRGIAEMMGLPPIYGLFAGKPKRQSSSGTLRSKASQSTLKSKSSSSTVSAAPLSLAFSPRLPPVPSGTARSPSPLRSPPVMPDAEFNVFDRSVTFSEDDANTAYEDLNGDLPKATLSRVLTNVVILQDFILELSAIMQVRAGLFDDDVTFC